MNKKDKKDKKWYWLIDGNLNSIPKEDWEFIPTFEELYSSLDKEKFILYMHPVHSMVDVFKDEKYIKSPKHFKLVTDRVFYFRNRSIKSEDIFYHICHETDNWVFYSKALVYYGRSHPKDYKVTVSCDVCHDVTDDSLNMILSAVKKKTGIT